MGKVLAAQAIRKTAAEVGKSLADPVQVLCLAPTRQHGSHLTLQHAQFAGRFRQSGEFEPRFLNHPGNRSWVGFIENQQFGQYPQVRASLLPRPVGADAVANCKLRIVDTA